MKCSHCNREIENESVFCEFCGKKVKRSKWPLFIVLALVVVGLVSFLLINESKEKRAREEWFYNRCNSANDYREYLWQYPDGRFVSQAKRNLNYLVQDSIDNLRAIQSAAERVAFNKCTTVQGCREYLSEFPNGERAKIVIDKLQNFIKDSIEIAQKKQQQEQTQRQYLGSSVKYVVIDGSELRLRMGPSTSYDTFKWPDGTNRHPKVGDAFRYLRESNGFFNIDFHGHSLWVSAEFSHIEYR